MDENTPTPREHHFPYAPGGGSLGRDLALEQFYLEHGMAPPWRQNWLDGVVVPRGEGGQRDRYTLRDTGRSDWLHCKWGERERQAVLDALAVQPED